MALMICSYFVALKTRILLEVSSLGQWIFSFVIIPNVPSPPINRFLISYPVLSLCIYDSILRMVPLGRTASIPKMWDLKDPCLTIYIPPAFVEAFPPSWQEPLAPKSRGTWQPNFDKCSFAFSSTTPASTVRTELVSSNLTILFIFFVLTTTSSKTGTLPPTKPVLPPCGTTANFLLLQYSRILEICWVFYGVKASWEDPFYILFHDLLKNYS